MNTTPVPHRARLATAVTLALAWTAPIRAQQPMDTHRGSADTAVFRSAGDSARLRMVQVGYGQRPAGEVTGAVTQIEASGFNLGRIVSLEQLIQGRVAGVQVVDNDEPGGSLAIRIRNPASLAGADPLYVVDGVPIRPGLVGGATSGRDALNFLDPEDIASITVLRDGASEAIYGMDAANGVVLITTRTGQGAPRLEYRASASSSSVTSLPDVLNASEFRAAVAQYAPQKLGLLGDANTDWSRLVTQAALGQSHHLALSEAWPSGTSRLSVGYLHENGVLRTSATERLSLGIHVDQRLLGDLLHLQLMANGARLYDRVDPAGLGGAALMAPTQPADDSATDNPLKVLQRITSSGTTYRGVAHLLAGLRMPFVPGLSAQVHVAYDGIGGDERQSSSSSYGVYHVNGTPHHSGNYLEAQLAWSATHALVPGHWDLLAGYERLRSHSAYQTTTGYNSGAATSSSEVWQDDTLRSFFGRLQYGLADRYFASASLRREHSSRFGPGHAWGTFPSAAVSWRIAQEPLLRRLMAGSDLTLRASWARTGNQGSVAPFSDLTSPVPADPNIRWERTTSYDVGLDLSLLGERVNGSFDWYTRRTDNLIYPVPTAGFSGPASYLLRNIGTLRNEGVEARLGARVLAPRGQGLAWSVAFTASHNTNRMLDMTVPPFADLSAQAVAWSSLIMKGQPLRTFYLFQQKYDPSGKPIEGSYADLNGDGVIDWSDARPYHDPAPQWILGHRSDLTWGSFDLSFTLRAYLGNWIYDYAAATFGTYRNLTSTDGWIPSNADASVLRTDFAGQRDESDYYVKDASFLRMDEVTLGWTIRRRPQPMRLFVTVQNVFTITGYSGLDPAVASRWGDFYPYPPSRTLVAGLDLRL